MEKEILTIAVIVFMIFLLIKEWFSSTSVFFGTLVFFMLTKIIDLKDALSGFSNGGMLTVAALFIVAGTLEKTFIIKTFSTNLFGSHNHKYLSLSRIMIPSLVISSFINNTPLVSILIPVIREWCRKIQVPSSRFLLPACYAVSFGGILTLIGTSTNIVVSGLLVQKGMEAISMFELTPIALPIVIIAVAFIIFIGSKLLPSYEDNINQVKNSYKEYLVNFIVEQDSVIIGKTVKKACLRHLDGLYLLEIKRKDQTIAPVSPNTILCEYDELIFVGRIDKITQVQVIKGLRFKIDTDINIEQLQNGNAEIVEAMVSDLFPYKNKTIKEMEFRSKYYAAVIAVVRNGERIKEKIGNIRIKQGDVLLLLAESSFKKEFNGKDFYVWNTAKAPNVLPQDKQVIPIILFFGIILLSILGILPILEGSFLALAILFLTKLVTPEEGFTMINWNTLLIIASSFGIGSAIEKSGAAELIANGILLIVKPNIIYMLLIAAFFITVLFTEIITNNAAAALAFPIVCELALKSNLNPRPFALLATIAASCTFSTPFGYQTNTMVYNAGGYKFKDFLKIGIPLNIIFMFGSTLMIYLIYFKI